MVGWDGKWLCWWICGPGGCLQRLTAWKRYFGDTGGCQCNSVVLSILTWCNPPIVILFGDEKLRWSAVLWQDVFREWRRILRVRCVPLSLKMYHCIQYRIIRSRKNIYVAFVVVICEEKTAPVSLEYLAVIATLHWFHLVVFGSALKTSIATNLIDPVVVNREGWSLCLSEDHLPRRAVTIAHSVIQILCHVWLVVTIAHGVLPTSLFRVICEKR